MSNDSVWLMCCCWWHICYCSLLAILRKKVGKPKEEIRNLYGFHKNSSNVNSLVSSEGQNFDLANILYPVLDMST
jgi:hypothetical protein